MFHGILLLTVSFSQNICPNGSFENFNPCPSSLSQLSFGYPWTDPPGSTTTSDLFNACHLNSMPVICLDVGVPENFGGYALAHSGNGYAGFIGYYGNALREYLEVNLDSTMDPGVAYRVEAYFRRSTKSRYAIDGIGLLISAGAIVQNGNLNIPITPQIKTVSVIADTSAWTMLTGIYVAAGGEDHLTIGNFSDNASTTIVDNGLQGSSCVLNNSGAYYYVDDVKIERINEKVIIVGDTLICPGGNTTLFADANIFTWWSTSLLPFDTLSTSPSIVVSPLVTTTYILNGVFIKDSVSIYIVPPPVVNLGNDTSICEGDFINLQAVNNHSVYLWSTGEKDSAIIANQNQLYWVFVDNGGCTASDSLDLTILPNPKIDLGSDSIFCSNDPEPLVLDAGEGISFNWQPTGDTSAIVMANQELTYMVTVTRVNGCTRNASLSVSEQCPVNIFIPNSFSPNDDGRNEIFFPIVRNALSYELKIFNRWGTLLFISDNPATGWDGTFRGKKLPFGNYFYVVKYGSITESLRIDKKTVRGSLLLLK